MSDKSNKCEHYYDGLCMCNPISNNDGVLLGYEECNKISNRCFWLTGQLFQAKHAELKNKHDKEKLDSELQQLKVENEDLKQECDLYKTWYRAKHDDLKNFLGQVKAENEELRKIQIGHCQGENLYNLYQYKQCLDEIKEICHNCWNCCDCKKCEYYEDCEGYLSSLILQKIEKVKGK